MQTLDVDGVRRRFLGLDGGSVLFDNAGGSQVLRAVAERVTDWYRDCNVQLGASYERSRSAGARLAQAQAALAAFVNATSPDEVVIGPSSTQLLAHLARSMSRRLSPGDEIILSMADHAANVTPWQDLARAGIVIRHWPVDPVSGLLDDAALEELLGPRTRLVCFTHCSNITGAIEPAADWVTRIRAAGALAVVDGVAYAPHRRVDLSVIGADIYVLSLYKTFGPHLAMMRIRKDVFLGLPGINHDVVAEDDLPYKFQPGNANYELTWGAAAIPAYIADLGGGEVGRGWDLIEAHETALVARLLDGLARFARVRVVGPPTPDPARRVALVSFVVRDMPPGEVVAATDAAGVGIRHGSFYSPWLVDSLGLTGQGGVVRVSMAHYNTPAEVDRLLAALAPVAS